MVCPSKDLRQCKTNLHEIGWTLATWPCQSPSARQAFQEMLSDHKFRPNPVQVYDTDGSQVPPKEWHNKLPGADVRVKVVITHQWFTAASNRSDNYYADIVELHILRPPRPKASPVKAKSESPVEPLAGKRKGAAAGSPLKRAKVERA